MQSPSLVIALLSGRSCSHGFLEIETVNSDSYRTTFPQLKIPTSSGPNPAYSPAKRMKRGKFYVRTDLNRRHQEAFLMEHFYGRHNRRHRSIPDHLPSGNRGLHHSVAGLGIDLRCSRPVCIRASLADGGKVLLQGPSKHPLRNLRHCPGRVSRSRSSSADYGPGNLTSALRRSCNCNGVSGATGSRMGM